MVTCIEYHMVPVKPRYLFLVQTYIFIIDYYQSVNPWTMYGEIVKVVTDNDHLGQVVSGIDQQQKILMSG